MAAIIWGKENFAAKKLIKALEDKGVNVVADDSEKAAYIFDFEGREDKWESLSEEQKLCLVAVNDQEKAERWKKRVENFKLNWRVVSGINVYGEGMGTENFLGRAFYLAAKNKNLILPSLAEDFTLLAVDDLVEAMLRACFLSGTLGELLVVSGDKYNSKRMAEVLIDEAKMTRNQVVEMGSEVEEADPEEVLRSREILRWQPEISFKEGAKEVVQYFVSKVDEENRKKDKEKVVPKRTVEIEREKVERRFEVVAEEPEFVFEEKEKIEEEIEPEAEPIVGKKLIWEEKEEEVKEFQWESLINSKKLKVESQKEESQKVENPPPAPLLKMEGKEIGVKKKSKWQWWVLILFLGVFSGIFLVNLGKIILFPENMIKVLAMVEKGDYAKAEKEIGVLKKENQRQLNLMVAFDWNEMGREMVNGIRAEGDGMQLLESGLNLAKKGEKISEGFFGGGEVEMKTEINNVESDLEVMIGKMGLLEARLSDRWQWLPGRYREKLDELKGKIGEERRTAEAVDKMMPVLPELLGFDGKRRDYLVLLQNESELRPGGGFIGSYAILSVEGGKWLNFEIEDIYEADGQLKGHVEPPEEIKKYLGEAAWYMRDANWKASFPEAAKDIQWFLEKETGRKVDGVIGINLAVVKSLLGVSGELFVSDFQEKVNKDNLYEQAEFYSENKFFPGSVQKASFLGAVSKSLIEEIKGVRGKKGMELLKAMMEMLSRREIQIALNESKAAKQLKAAKWDGAIYEGKCSGDNCLADYLYIVEANLGVNKANYFLYRNLERQINISENEVVNDLKIVYENTAKSTAWPGGDYKNYMRIYIPAGADVEEVSWSEKGSGAKNIISGSDLKYDLKEGKREIGFLVKVPIGKKIMVEFKYKQKIDLKGKEKFSYLSYVQKQSGFGDTGMVNLISFPNGWQVTEVSPAANVIGGKLLFNLKLDQDIQLGVEMGR